MRTMSFGAGVVMSAERVRARPAIAAPERPAFYALGPGGWRDLITLLHPPYTAWHLSYVAIGAALAPHAVRRACSGGSRRSCSRSASPRTPRRAARPTARHASERPHADRARAVALAGALAIGVAGAVDGLAGAGAGRGRGVFFLLAYDLEWFGGRLHNDFWFALAGGPFPRRPASGSTR